MEPQQPPDQSSVPAPQQPPEPAPTPVAPPAPAAASTPAYAPPPAAAPAPPAAPAPSAWATPEVETGPAPGVRFAGHGARLVAYIVDGIILAAVTLVVSLVLFTIMGAAIAGEAEGLAAISGLIWFVVVVVVSLAYFPYFWAKSGQTPGMKMFRLRVVRDADGGPISGGTAVLRLIGLWVSGAVFYLGYIWIFIDKRRRGWHDLIAGTIVIEQ